MRSVALFLAASLCLSCSWSRFDDLETDTPAVTLKKPSKLAGGFGVSLTTTQSNARVQLLVGAGAGISAAALFDLGSGESPIRDAVDAALCVGSQEPCHLAVAPAGAAKFAAPDKERELCFLAGAGFINNSHGLIMYCDQIDFGLAVPEAVRKLIERSLAEQDSFIFAAASERNDRAPANPQQLLLAAAPEAKTAWFYPPSTTTPAPVELVLPLPNPDESYGRVVSVASVGSARLLAVAAPEQGNVRLFRSNDGSTAEYIGCLGGSKGFGRAMTAGFLDSQPGDELVIADDNIAYAFSASVLLSLPTTSAMDCSLGALPAGALYTSVTCGTTKSVGSCDGANFGAALALGDLDGDGDGELIVGAPGMEVRGEKRAGALLVFDADTAGDAAFREIQFLSSAEEGDQLGAALATPLLGTRHIIAAGAPTGGKVALFYCSQLLPADKRGARCK
jgi:hypothetical protein